MKNTYQTKNPNQTKKLGKTLAKKLLQNRVIKSAKVLSLVGDLGGGKTTFLQGFARGLGVRQKITSPTFVIFKRFKLKNQNFKNFYHFDCYRIQKPKEIMILNFKEIISDPQNIVAIEWADKIKKIIPKNSITLNFKFININQREIKINDRI